jgi:drug/metabolite transporter (DMT)-like permease
MGGPAAYVWLAPALATLLLWGLGQGLLKQFIGEAPPARFCLYYVFARGAVDLGFYLSQAHHPYDLHAKLSFLATGVVAYLFDGLGWILYFESIIAGPITIIGTLSAAYPALTILLAHVFLGEELVLRQYLATAMVLGGCIGLAVPGHAAGAKPTGNGWILTSFGAVLFWAVSQLTIKIAFHKPQAHAEDLALCSLLGSALTLGVYGLVRGGRGSHQARAWLRSFLPMGMLAGGDLGLILANRTGPISVISPLTAAYPAVTIAYAALVLKEKISVLQWCLLAVTLLGIFLLSS